MKNLTLNVYDEKGKEVIKACKANSYDLSFGTIRKLMGLLKIDETTNQGELFKILNNAWDEVTNVLSDIFPDISNDEWDRVKVKELMPVIIKIVKSVVADFMSIPADPKN